MSDAELFTVCVRLSVEDGKALFFVDNSGSIDPALSHVLNLCRSLGQRLLEAEVQGVEIEGEVDIRWSFSANKFPDQWNNETDAAMREAISRRRGRLWINRKKDEVGDE